MQEDRSILSTFQELFLIAEYRRFLQENYGVLPKAAAITIGGLAGFFLGMKKLVSDITVVLENQVRAF